MSAAMLPADLPGLREEAERLAREAYEAGSAEAHRLHRRGPFLPWPRLPPAERAFDTDAHVAILRDLTRPASRDWAARLLAERIGLAVGATAPEWLRANHVRGDGWVLDVHGSDCLLDRAPKSYRWFADTAHEADSVVVPGISALTDPAAALAAAVMAVAGGAS